LTEEGPLVAPNSNDGNTEKESPVAPKTGKQKTADGGSPVSTRPSQLDIDWSSILSEKEDISTTPAYLKDLFNREIEKDMTDEQRFKRHCARKAYRNSARALKQKGKMPGDDTDTDCDSEIARVLKLKRKMGDDTDTDCDSETKTKKQKPDHSESKLEDYVNKEYFDA
jgi:hypothetical protein